jgi:hypothetical protein
MQVIHSIAKDLMVCNFIAKNFFITYLGYKSSDISTLYVGCCNHIQLQDGVPVVIAFCSMGWGCHL